MRLAYRLGAHLGILHVERDIIKKLPAKEFLRWEAYEQIEPFGEWRADVRAALIAQQVFNMAVKEEHRKDLKFFLPDWQKWADEAYEREQRADNPPPRVKQTVDEQIAIAKMWVAAFNASQPEEPA